MRLLHCSILASSIFFLSITAVFAATKVAPAFNEELKTHGKEVYMHGWGGSERINSYITWAAQRIEADYGIKLKYVKSKDVTSIVSRILAEKAAGRNENGSVDIIWLNGDNFRAMKDNNLLYGPFVHELPAFRMVDTQKNPTTIMDFGTPTDGLEAPWGMAQLVFMYDSARLDKPPSNAQELLQLAKKYPHKITYGLPPDFIGTTFLKQLLCELIDDPAILQKPVTEVDFNKVTAPLWQYLDELHPYLWRDGKSFPAQHLSMNSMLDDGELLISMTFNRAYASAAILNGLFADTVRTYVHEGGTLRNTHFLAIPYNSNAKAAAKVVINFLLSPEAQAKKMDLTMWGDPTVLSMGRLSAEDQQLFKALPKGLATLTDEEIGIPLPEPHYSWTRPIEEAWLARYR